MSHNKNKGKECKECKESIKTKECYGCEKMGCATCIQTVCCDCSVSMCNKCKDNSNIYCGCFGNCSHCEKDVNRGDDGWPCGECDKWLCQECRNDPTIYASCNECRDNFMG